VVELSNANEKNVGSYRYSPYGEELDPNASETADARSNPTRYAGQYLDQDSGLYYMRAREYDPETGRFLEQDPKEEELGEQDLSDYLYAEDDSTLLTDPSGLDPSFGGKTLKCKKNKLLCETLRQAGYKTGCRGHCFRNVLVALSYDGIEYSDLRAVANGKGKIKYLLTGPRGYGYYFFSRDGKERKLEAPNYDPPHCGWVCSAGFLFTQVVGCNSEVSCAVMGALMFIPTPTTKGVAAARSSRFRKLLNIFRIGKRGKQAEAAARVAKGAEKGFPELKASLTQLEKKFKHAADFGVTESRGSSGFKSFGEAMTSFMKKPSTKRITGKYRGQAAILNYDSKSKLIVVQRLSGNFVSGWRMSKAQLKSVVEKGSLR
jgi:RHS repeat-associated protein